MHPTTLDPEQCYQALVTRDARFDGRFFAGVLTTGIFCRPICPAPKPRRRNVSFYRSAAAAAADGLRPCLRCRPEAAPGTPGWLGTEATVRCAMRRIAVGALDGADLDHFAATLGVGARHLRRLFSRHLGASPDTVARTRRILFAKKLIDQTDLPMTKVAFSSGFSSVRRFNAALRETYGRSPSEVRRLARRTARSFSGKGLELTLSVREPFDWSSLVGFLAPRATPGVELVTAESYRRTFCIGASAGLLEVRPVTGRAELALRIHVDQTSGLLGVVERARQLFDMDADPLAMREQWQPSGRLRELSARRPGLRIPGAWDPLELALRAILGQQITVAGATTLAGRLVQTFGAPYGGDTCPGLSHHFPTAEVLAEADLGQIGLPRARQRTIRAVARAACEGIFERVPTSLDDLIATWTELAGIGPWTAHYVALRVYREPDAFPASDLGLRRALARGASLPSVHEVRERTEAWRPWRAYAAMQLWASLGEQS